MYAEREQPLINDIFQSIHNKHFQGGLTPSLRDFRLACWELLWCFCIIFL